MSDRPENGTARRPTIFVFHTLAHTQLYGMARVTSAPIAERYLVSGAPDLSRDTTRTLK